MIAGKKQCARKNTQQQPWSPTQRKIAHIFTYWKQKANMSKKKLFHWNHLEKLRKFTDITDQEHQIRDLPIITQKL